MSIRVLDHKYPHLKWIDLEGDGDMVECAVMKTDVTGGIFFIRLEKLDSIDKRRLVKIISNRNANSFELWDLMGSVTLGNGLNALKYFHQLVQIITPEGKIYKPTMGRQGIQLIDTNPKKVPTAEEMATAEQMLEAGNEAGVKPKTTRATRTRKAAVKKKA